MFTLLHIGMELNAFLSSTRRSLPPRLVPHPSGSIRRLDVNSIRARLQSVPMSASGVPTPTFHCSARPVRSALSLPMVAHAAAMLRRQCYPLLLCFLSAASAGVCAPSSTCDGPRRVVNLRNLFSVCKKSPFFPSAERKCMVLDPAARACAAAGGGARRGRRAGGGERRGAAGNGRMSARHRPV